jgi:hypothetical protein
MATRSHVRGNLVPDILVKPANAFICQVLDVTHTMTFKYRSTDGKPHRAKYPAGGSAPVLTHDSATARVTYPSFTTIHSMKAEDCGADGNQTAARQRKH